jgi:hypothetical protein
MSKTKNFKAREEMWQALRIAHQALYKASDADVDAETLSTISDAIDTVSSALVSEREVSSVREYQRAYYEEAKKRQAWLDDAYTKAQASLQASHTQKHPPQDPKEVPLSPDQERRFYEVLQAVAQASANTSKRYEDLLRSRS